MNLRQQKIITEAPETGNCVVYIMSRDQRVRDNFALLYAQAKAQSLQLPLVVVFNLLSTSGYRAYEHVVFMLDGLQEVERDLKKLRIPFIMCNDVSKVTLHSTLQKLQPAAIYFDFSPLKGPQRLVQTIAKKYNKSTYVVDTHNIIPIWVASDKQEFAAYTFRHKVHKNLQEFLVEPPAVLLHTYQLDHIPETLSFTEAENIIDSYPKNGISVRFKPGEKAASYHLQNFIENTLPTYATERNNIAQDNQSGLSPYLHFGHISSLRVALEVLYSTAQTPLLFTQAKMASAGDSPSATDGMNALFEEMIVRKELSDNFCYFAPHYIDFSGVPAWAQATLKAHADDPREHAYSLEQLRSAQTADEAWNASQKELLHTGKIHGYMRMYWAKKILEWTSSPEEALQYAITLNDTYSIDGGDPNGYTGILWAIAGLHDRPWAQRSIFGTIRFMNAAGLRRKFDVDTYIKKCDQL